MKGGEVSTLKDVKQVVANFKQGTELYGATKEVLMLFQEKLEPVGNAIQEEQKVSAEEAINLPDDTVLGDLAESKFSEFKEWVYNLS